MTKKTHPSNYYYNDNRRHKIPPPEDLLPNIPHSFSYNPETQPLTPKFTLDLITFHNGIDLQMKNLKYCTIKMNIELSSSSRWHYHGIIIIKDIMKFFIFDLPFLKENAAFEIDTIKEETKDVWTNYCTKQEKIMKPITQEYGIPYTYQSDQIMKVKVQPLNDTKFTELMKLTPTSDYHDD